MYRILSFAWEMKDSTMDSKFFASLMGDKNEDEQGRD